MSERVKVTQGNYCLQYGYMSRSHTCINRIEAMNSICLECKEITMRKKVNISVKLNTSSFR